MRFNSPLLLYSQFLTEWRAAEEEQTIRYTKYRRERDGVPNGDSDEVKMIVTRLERFIPSTKRQLSEGLTGFMSI